jgi:hypothetical protein
MKIARSVLILMLTALSGCATPYQPFELFGRGGYTDHQTSDDTVEVSFYANGLTNVETMDSVLLYRAAAVTLEKHFDYFERLGGYRRIPLSAYGGFKVLSFTIKMHNGQPLASCANCFVAKALVDQYGPYIGQQK